MWVDPKWSQTMKNALAVLWKMYEDSMIDQIKAQTKCNREISHLSEQKDKVQMNILI